MSWNLQSTPVSADVLAARISAFLGRVYAWMFLGLLVTAGVALTIASSAPLIEGLIRNRLVLWVMIFAQLGLVLYLSARVEKISATTAGALFLVYSATVGVTTSVIILAFTGASLFSTFVVTAGMFGALALFGTFTKRSLAGVGQFMFMGLIGLIIASVVNFFVVSSAVNFVISVVGVIVFTGLTAWDAQRLKQMAVAMPDGRTGSYAIFGALSLYLDFINLFFFLCGSWAIAATNAIRKKGAREGALFVYRYERLLSSSLRSRASSSTHRSSDHARGTSDTLPPDRPCCRPRRRTCATAQPPRDRTGLWLP